MDARQRRELARYGPPAAFLAAVTIAVLLIKAGLDSGKTTTTTQLLPTTTHRTTTRRVVTGSSTTTVAQYYTIQSGDTLGAIAGRQNTTVADLLRLNPGIDPRTLHSGQRIRIR